MMNMMMIIIIMMNILINTMMMLMVMSMMIMMMNMTMMNMIFSIVNDHDDVNSYVYIVMVRICIQTVRHDKLAEMLTIIESEDFLLSLRAREFIGLRWTKKVTKTLHPDLGGAATLSRYIHSSNQRIAWIAHEIIDHGAVVGPTHECIEYFLKVAKCCLKLNNFNCVFQIVAALGSCIIIIIKMAMR